MSATPASASSGTSAFLSCRYPTGPVSRFPLPITPIRSVNPSSGPPAVARRSAPHPASATTRAATAAATAAGDRRSLISSPRR